MLLTNVKLVNFNKLDKRNAIYIKKGIIKGIGYSADLIKSYPKEDVFDLKGKTLFPGLINAHMHGYGILSSYFMDKTFNWKDVFERLKELQFKKEDMELVYYSAIMAGIFAIRNGITTVFDICYGNPMISEMIAEAYKVLGLRGVVYQSLDKKNSKFLNSYKSKEFGNVVLGVALSSNKDYIPIIKSLSDEDRIMVHEDQVSGEEESLLKALIEKSLITDSIVFVHGRYSEDSLSLFKGLRVNLVSCPLVDDLFTESEKFIDSGINFCMGSGMLDMNIFMASKEAFKHSNLTIKEIDNIIENNNSELAYRVLGQRVGKIEEGYRADFFTAKSNPIIKDSEYNFVYRDNFWVEDVVVDGKFILKDGEVLGAKEDEVYKSIKEYVLRS
jgi:cytosine/adenosine deaminase-related metal-dependent hydrolase